jgi:signal transduction histidine kinase
MQNSIMQELMQKTAGRVFFNGKLYLNTVVVPNAEHRDEDNYLYKLPDGEWLFTVRKIRTGNRYVTQLTAADVTEQNRENLVLRQKHKELENQHEQLKILVRNIEKTCRGRELLRIKAGIHDKQNEKLTSLLQYIRYEQLPDGESFATIKESVLNSLAKTGTETADPKPMLEAMINQYGSVDVKIKLTGDLPPEQDIAIAFVQILQEAVANAVTHGYANEVYGEITGDSTCAVMRVTDNSPFQKEEIREGSGIAGMRRCSETLGGGLTIETTPRFALSVSIPKTKGESNE